MLRIVIIAMAISVASNADAQMAERLMKNKKVIGYPLGFYTPETGLGIGVAGTLNFRPVKSDTLSPVSQISLGAAFTQNKQLILSVPFALYVNNRRHTVTGEFSYNDFWYYYYGTGNSNRAGDKAKYDVEFPLFRVNYLYRVKRNFYLGARWWFENYRVSAFEDAEIFAGQNMSFGRSSGPGMVFLFDSRDNIYYPKKGQYLELVAHDQSKEWGSDFRFQRFRADYRVFLPASVKSVLALHGFADFVKGNTPFNQLPGIGAGRRGRGFYEGRFRDRGILLLEAEFRRVLNAKWAIATFMNYAMLGNDDLHFSLASDHLAVGAGIRYAFDTKNKTNLRLDIAFPVAGGEYITAPDGVMKIYLAVNEAF
jgi:outer membrane protein assembly factor BamA